MHIQKLQIEGFKSFEKVEFHFNPDLNVLTGANNSGKTTVLEAIALWAECFHKRIWQATQTDKKRGLKSGQHRLDHWNSYGTLSSVRISRFEDIFHDLDRDVEINLTATLEDRGEALTIDFLIRAVRGSSYHIEQRDTGSFDLERFNTFFQKLPRPLSVVYASPVAALLPREDFETLPKVHALVDSRRSMQVLRNRLYQLRKNAVLYQAFIDSVAYVLSDAQQPLELSFEGDELTSVEIPVRVKVGSADVWKDISLLGSGTVQIIEIMLAVHADPRDLNLILLDEPDSHIHRDIQRRLVKKLVEHTVRTQVFLTTHNESFIRSTRPEHLFHLDPRQNKTYYPIYRDTAVGVKRGLQPSRQLKILRTLGSETSIDWLNAIEAERLVLVEGEDDARFIQSIVEGETSPPTRFHAMYWSFDGVDTVFERIGLYRDFFQHFKNDKTLWEKAVLVIDRDYLTDRQREALMRELASRIGVPVYVSASYTMEATLLSELPKLKVLIAQLALKEEKRSVSSDDVDQLVNAEVEALAQTLSKRLDEANFKSQLYYRLRTRREQLQELGVKGAVLPYDGLIQPEFEGYARDALTQRRIHLLASKDDVLSLLQGVYGGLSIAFRPEALFERMIDAATPTTWFEEWRELRRVVSPR
jgi:ABC-type transport system involved in cytochrome c biogenesis ATPase subunit